VPGTEAALDPLDFTDRTVLVVGGSGGIGHGIATAFAQRGATVHITGTRCGPGDYPGLADPRLTYHQLDVTSDAAVAALLPDLSALDTLVCCAGTVAYQRGEYELATFRRVVAVNLTGVMSMCVRFQPHLATAAGSVVVVGSLASFIAVPGQPAYSASKGGLRTLVMSLADAWARDGIRVNGIAPGYVDTKLTAATTSNDEALTATLRKIPLGRWGEPAEMGFAVLFLASSMASYITGQMLQVDGGITLR
jgi:3-oxoacyl-[acyl-carrier protein] reductase